MGMPWRVQPNKSTTGAGWGEVARGEVPEGKSASGDEAARGRHEADGSQFIEEIKII